MLTYALTAFLVLNGQVHAETLDWGLTMEDCELLQVLTTEVEVVTDADVVPLACVPEREA